MKLSSSLYLYNKKVGINPQHQRVLQFLLTLTDCTKLSSNLKQIMHWYYVAVADTPICTKYLTGSTGEHIKLS